MIGNQENKNEVPGMYISPRMEVGRIDPNTFKAGQLRQKAEFRDRLRVRPELRYLFFELTDRCNLACLHCGSGCHNNSVSFLEKEEIMRVLRSVCGKLDPHKTMLCITGGEPLLHPDFFAIMQDAVSLGFPWGMTCNGTLISREIAVKLKAVQMGTITISLDGLSGSHNRLRGTPGAFDASLRGIAALQDAGFEVQVTTVAHRGNINELDAMYRLLCQTRISSWRVINMEPIGRALEHPELLLSAEQHHRLLDFIRAKRFDADNAMEVTFGCSHYLPLEYERMVRDFYFLCIAGLQTAGITAKGDIVACLDIERHPGLKQGSIHTDDFMDAWEHGFTPFRSDRTACSSVCANCPDRTLCAGDSAHTWDYIKNEPMLCIKNLLKGV